MKKCSQYTAGLGLMFAGEATDKPLRDIALNRVLEFGRLHRHAVMAYEEGDPRIAEAKKHFDLTKNRFNKEYPGYIEGAFSMPREEPKAQPQTAAHINTLRLRVMLLLGCRVVVGARRTPESKVERGMACFASVVVDGGEPILRTHGYEDLADLLHSAPPEKIRLKFYVPIFLTKREEKPLYLSATLDRIHSLRACKGGWRETDYGFWRRQRAKQKQAMKREAL